VTDRRYYLEDMQPGMSWTSPPVPITQDAIIAFARAYDPQPFHTDPASPETAPFGGLIASGWQVTALTMRQMVEMRPFGLSPMLGLGVDELRWLRPVRPGDELVVRLEIVDVRPSQSRPGKGVIRAVTTVVNQQGETVMRFVSNLQLTARPAGGGS
jgi:acyl dehydratase